MMAPATAALGAVLCLVPAAILAWHNPRPRLFYVLFGAAIGQIIIALAGAYDQGLLP